MWSKKAQSELQKVGSELRKAGSELCKAASGLVRPDLSSRRPDLASARLDLGSARALAGWIWPPEGFGSLDMGSGRSAGLQKTGSGLRKALAGWT